MINIKALKEQLTIEDIEQVIEALEIPITHRGHKIFSLKGGCHCLDCSQSDSNLKFYVDTQTFTCFSHECLVGGDIIELVLARKRLTKPNYKFMDAIKFIVQNSNISIEKITSNSTNFNREYNMMQFINKYIKHDISTQETTIFNENILNFLDDIYPDSWVDEGISYDTMEEFELKYYPRLCQICIPVRNEDGNLVGIHCRNQLPELVEHQKYIPLRLLDETQYNFPSNGVLYGLYNNMEAIVKSKKVIIVESPKSVMQLHTMGINNAVGIFGLNLGEYRSRLLLDLGIEEAIIAIDKDYTDLDTPEFKQFEKNVYRLSKALRGHCVVSVMYDDDGLLDMHDSPSDKGKEIWDKLYEERIEL